MGNNIQKYRAIGLQQQMQTAGDHAAYDKYINKYAADHAEDFVTTILTKAGSDDAAKDFADLNKDQKIALVKDIAGQLHLKDQLALLQTDEKGASFDEKSKKLGELFVDALAADQSIGFVKIDGSKYGVKSNLSIPLGRTGQAFKDAGVTPFFDAAYNTELEAASKEAATNPKALDNAYVKSFDAPVAAPILAQPDKPVEVAAVTPFSTTQSPEAANTPTPPAIQPVPAEPQQSVVDAIAGNTQIDAATKGNESDKLYSAVQLALAEKYKTTTTTPSVDGFKEFAKNADSYDDLVIKAGTTSEITQDITLGSIKSQGQGANYSRVIETVQTSVAATDVAAGNKLLGIDPRSNYEKFIDAYVNSERSDGVAEAFARGYASLDLKWDNKKQAFEDDDNQKWNKNYVKIRDQIEGDKANGVKGDKADFIKSLAEQLGLKDSLALLEADDKDGKPLTFAEKAKIFGDNLVKSLASEGQKDQMINITLKNGTNYSIKRGMLADQLKKGGITPFFADDAMSQMEAAAIDSKTALDDETNKNNVANGTNKTSWQTLLEKGDFIGALVSIISSFFNTKTEDNQSYQAQKNDPGQNPGSGANQYAGNGAFQAENNPTNAPGNSGIVHQYVTNRNIGVGLGSLGGGLIAAPFLFGRTLYEKAKNGFMVAFHKDEKPEYNQYISGDERSVLNDLSSLVDPNKPAALNELASMSHDKKTATGKLFDEFATSPINDMKSSKLREWVDGAIDYKDLKGEDRAQATKILNAAREIEEMNVKYHGGEAKNMPEYINRALDEQQASARKRHKGADMNV